MGKKKRGHPDVEEILGRAWCYYCERDFEDLKLLISHQKAKHFKCDRCGRRLNTAGGLSVHLNQVHKETLTQVENALPNRQGLEVEIFGMEGIPQEILDQHRNRIIQNYYQAQEDRRIATGNPLPGQSKENSRKRLKIETPEELKQRLEAHRAQKKAAPTLTGAEGVAPSSGSPAQYVSSLARLLSNTPTDALRILLSNLPLSSTTSNTRNQASPRKQHHLLAHMPSPPTVTRPTPYLHDRQATCPAHQDCHSGQPRADSTARGAPPAEAAHGAAPGDDIDQLIRMAEAGIKPGQKPEGAAEETGEKKTKKDKDKKSKMMYDDADTSPEERMAALPRYSFAQEIAV
ncbi:hypothetical protein G7046_g1661 [Stylonectria norvegica]|nr:hypothetical protein G7046_g1661 [Stylonectria norvegica]